jgi:hypothetical protein
MPFDPIENVWAAREMEEIIAAKQARAAANDLLADVAPRFREAKRWAEQQVVAAQRALDAADQAVRAEIARLGLSDQAANTKYELATAPLARALEAAADRLRRAETQLGEQVLAVNELSQLERNAPALHQQIDADCQRRHQELETRLLLARSRVST